MIRSLKLISVTFLLCIWSEVVIGQCCSNGVNLLANYNPDFSVEGNPIPPGFVNDNDYTTVLGPGFYSVIVSRNYGACSQTPEYDHTYGDATGKYLWFDTAGDATAINPAVAWIPYDPTRPAGLENLIDVTPNTYYVFSVWIRDLARNTDCITGGAPIMGLRINGVDMAEIDLEEFTSPCCPEWIYLCSEWFSGEDTLAEIKIESRTGEGFTDLGIDDVYFGTTFPDNADILGNDISACTNEEIVLYSGISNGDVVWNDGSTADSLVVTESGYYWLDIEQSGCDGSDTIFVSFNSEVPELWSEPNISICENEPFYLTPELSPIGSYLWQDGTTAQSLYIDQPGDYWLQVSTECGVALDTIEVEIAPSPEVIESPDVFLCDGSNVILVPIFQNEDYVLWSDGSMADSLIVEQAGTFWIQAINQCGSDADTIVVSSDIPELIIDWNIVTRLDICGKNLFVDASFTGSGANTLSWNNGESATSSASQFSFIYSGENIHTLTLQAIDACGDAQTLSQSFEFNPLIRDFSPAIPTIFSPNGDGKNDVFLPFDLSDQEETDMSFNIKIYNRWGNLLFEKEKVTSGWNGQFNGTACAEGIYFYIVDYLHPCNEEKIQKEGWLTLVR